MISTSPPTNNSAKTETVLPNSEKISSSTGLFKGNPSTPPAQKECSAPDVHCSSALATQNPPVSQGTFIVPPQGKARQRNSISVNAVGTLGTSLLTGLSDYDSDEDDGKNLEVKNESSTSIPVVVSNPKASGGPQHRPLVGGFAAAAYEAARVDYYKKQGMQVTGHENVQMKSRSRGQLPKYP